MNNLVTLVAVAAVAVAVALIPVMPGVAVYDAIFKVQPTIPDPGAVPALAGVHSLPSRVIVETIEVKVRKADRDRFIRTIKRDAIAAGGWTKVEPSPRWANVFTVVVPESYLGRVDPLLEDSAGAAVHPNYQSWSTTVAAAPPRGLDGSEMVQIRFRVKSDVNNFLDTPARAKAFMLGLLGGLGALALAFACCCVWQQPQTESQY